MSESNSKKTVALQAGSPGNQEGCPPDPDRREALKKLGKFAAYTAPAMMVVLLPKKKSGVPPSPHHL